MRPCVCGKCRLCWLAEHDPRYAALWGVTPKRRGLGDWVAAALAWLGITKTRADRVAKAVGRPSCGCAARQQRLNDLGKKIGIGG